MIIVAPAARLTALARRNRVLVDDATVAALPPAVYESLRLTARQLRGFGMVEPVRRVRIAAGQWVDAPQPNLEDSRRQGGHRERLHGSASRAGNSALDTALCHKNRNFRTSFDEASRIFVCLLILSDSNS